MPDIITEAGYALDIADISVPVFPSETFTAPDFYDVQGMLHEHFHGYSVETPAWYVHCFKNGYVIPFREEIFTSAQTLVLDATSQKSNPLLHDIQPLFSHATKVRGVVAHLYVRYYDDNYYHWLIEHLGRLQILRKSGLEPDYYVILNKHAFHKEYLQLLDIPEEKVIFPHTNDIIQADLLVYPTLLNNWKPLVYNNYQLYYKEFYPSWIGDLYKEMLKKMHIAYAPRHRLYISRNDSTTRRFANEKQVSRIVKKFGYTPITLTGMSVVQQIKLFSKIKNAVGVNGAGFSNLFFAPPGIPILEAYPKHFHDPSFRLLSGVLQLQYNYMISHHENEHDARNHPQHSSVYVHPDIFEKALEMTCAQEP